MDVTQLKKKALEGMRKHKYALLVAALGIVLLCIPFGETDEAVSQTQIQSLASDVEVLEQKLADILSGIEGAGKVQVVLTTSASQMTVYQEDTDLSGGDAGASRYDTVIVKDAQGNEMGLIRQVIGARYQGAIILCQGAARADVKLAIVEAVSKATGLGADKISVLKMK